MALITENPGGLPPEENTLRDIPDDLLGPMPVMVRHSNRDLFVMDNPPGDDDWIRVEYTFRAGDLIRKKPDSDGVRKYVRLLEFLGAKLTVGPYLYVNLTQDHCDGLIRDHLGEEVVAQASS